MSLDIDDLEPLLDEVARFCAERLADATARHERVLEAAPLRALSREAVALGLLPEPGAAEPSGLWVDTDQAASMALSLGILQHTARASASIAYAWHRASLAAWLARAAGLAAEGGELLDVTLLPSGRWGAGREAFGRWLCGHDDDPGLADWLDRSQETVLHAPHDWRRLAWPVWRGGTLVWQFVERGALQVRAAGAAHGQNDLGAFGVSAAAGTPGRLVDVDTRRLTRELLVLDQLGLSAIALGVLDHGQTMAVAFAAARRQGGVPIERHPAVQSMLADIASARLQTQQQLQSFWRPLGAIAPAQAVALRLSTSATLVAATNQVMQVHGGIGYMREMGPERLVRDQNQLRLAGGGVWGLDLLLQALHTEEAR